MPDPAPLRDIFHIGQVTAPHGVKGEVRVHVLSEAADRFRGLSGCLLVSPDGKDRCPVRILQMRGASGNLVILTLEDVNGREAAEKLRGWYLSVPREEALPLQDGEYFISDLIGCVVFGEAEGELGRVRDVLKTGANDVYLVRRPHGKDLLVPATRQVVRSVDIEGRRIVVALPDGLLEIYE